MPESHCFTQGFPLGWRKVYECGRNNAVIGIPKLWRDSVGLKIGDQVSIEVHSDGLMIRVPKR